MTVLLYLTAFFALFALVAAVGLTVAFWALNVSAAVEQERHRLTDGYIALEISRS